MDHQPIAIVGIACRYPDAKNPKELWENVLAKRRAFRRIPTERLNLNDYFSADRTTPDAIYCDQAAVIEGYEFDRVKYRVSGGTYNSTDLTHWLALDVAAQALQDAGFPAGEGLNREQVGVLVGNTLTGEFSRASLMRLRWPFVRRMVDAELRKQDWDEGQRLAFLASLEANYKSPFAPVGEETLAGGLANTIAGRICNHFDFHGGGYTLDGACSSSLLAVVNACNALRNGDLDAAVTGGVDLSLDPFELIGFSKTGALADGNMRVYDAAANGFLPGEGCGFMVLMRYDDAVACGARCYGLIRGWGISSDGSGGITRPEIQGQRLALERAYRKAGYGIDTVPLFEGHGTGTNLGDKVELAALNQSRQQANPQTDKAAISSIKANIGHTKAAAGIAGLLKAVMALHHQMLPAATGVEQSNALFNEADVTLRLLPKAQLWPEDKPLRVGVSSFGFGGINVHLALESPQAMRRTQLTAGEQDLLASAQDCEVFLLAAADVGGLSATLTQLLAIAPRLSLAEMGDLSATLARQLPSGGAVRASLVASTPKQLTLRLARLQEQLAAGVTTLFDETAGIFLATQDTAGRVTLLFAGQASPVRLDGAAWMQRFTHIQALYERAVLQGGGNLQATELAQPAIISAELAGLEMLAALGIQGQQAIGHSVGEFAALYWAGALDEAALLEAIRVRGQAMAGVETPGGMLSLAVDGGQAESLCAGLDGVGIACFNSTRQTIIAGEQKALEQLVRRLDNHSIRHARLPVSHAFHSSLMQSAGEKLDAHLAQVDWQPLQRRVISTISGAELAADADLRALLKQQMTAPVRFTQALEQVLADTDLFIEVAPGQVLTGLVRHMTDIPVVSMDAADTSLRGLLSTVAAVHVLGVPWQVEALFRSRFTRLFPLPLDWQPRFFANPCELAPQADSTVVQQMAVVTAVTAVAASENSTNDEEPPVGGGNVLERLRQMIADKIDLPLATIQDDNRMLSDLHLNSITVGQIVTEVGRQVGLQAPADPTLYANASLLEIARAIEERLASGEAGLEQAPALPAGIDAWIHAFVVEQVEAPVNRRALVADARGRGGWQVFGEAGEDLQQALDAWGGAGVVFCLPTHCDAGLAGSLLEAAKVVVRYPDEKPYFVLVQEKDSAAAFARTLHREQPALTVCVVTLARDEQWLQRVLDEVRIAHSYHEIAYDEQGNRRQRVLNPLPFVDAKPPLPFTADDVMLVSGGGKGITAECAAALAQDCGLRLALLGRSAAGDDIELGHNLQRFDSMGIRFRYFQVDITDAAAVQTVVDEIQREWGVVTAILHGAGTNRPKTLQHLEEADFRRTLAPKVRGLANMLAAVEVSSLRFLCSFGSIIATIGMPGEADYALANEWLARMTTQFGAAHPHCRCLTLEWTVWSDVGMGRRLGSDEMLAQQGITPIPPDVGVALFLQAIAADWPDTVVISGRMPEVATLKLQRPDLPFLRFLEKPQVYYPGIELVVDADLSVIADPYLEDHVYHGERLLPAVMGLEAMAQAAATVLGVAQTPRFETVEFSRPVVVDAAAGETIRLVALVTGKHTVEVALRCAQTSFRVNHFRARCVFDDSPLPDLPELDALATHQPQVLADDPTPLLYGSLLFQEGRFQRIHAYRQVGAWQCVAEIAADASWNWFGRYLAQKLLLGDAGSRDATIHGIQVCIPHAQLLPVGIEKLYFSAPLAAGPWVLFARERWHKDDLFCYDLKVVTADGAVREIWQGLQLRRVGAIAWSTGWPVALLMPTIERRLQDLLPESGLKFHLECKEKAPDVGSDHAIARLVGTPVWHRPDGKPEIRERGVAVSASRSDDLTLVVMARGQVACDLEMAAPREEAIWNDLLGTHSGLVQQIMVDTGEPMAQAATRVWTLRECLKKAGALLDTPALLQRSEQDGWVLLQAGKMQVVSWVVQVRDYPHPLAMAILVGNQDVL